MSHLQRPLLACESNIEETGPTKPTTSCPGSTENTTDPAVQPAARKKSTQTDTFRCRINNDAKAIMKGLWHDVKPPYKPRDIKSDVANSSEWRTELQRQEKIDGWMLATSTTPGKIEMVRYRIIMKMRSDPSFIKIANKIPEPCKPAAMIKPATVAMSTPTSTPTFFPTSSSLKGGSKTACKREIIDVEDNDEDSLLESHPQLQQDHLKKRQRTGDFATQLKQSSSHNEDLELQLEEVRLKAQLQEVQIRRKMAVVKRRDEEAQKST